MLATIDPPLLIVALGVLCGMIAILAIQIRRHWRKRHGRKRVHVWTPY